MEDAKKKKKKLILKIQPKKKTRINSRKPKKLVTWIMRL